jgi:hypothetical protein
LKTFVIGPAVGLEIEAEIEEGIAQHALLTQEQRDEQSPEATVAVEKGVDAFELDMGETGLHEHGDAGSFCVQEALEIAHAGRDLLRRWGDERGIARPRAADPVLAAAKLARVLPFAASAGEQNSVYLAQQSQREQTSQNTFLF